MRWSAPLVLLLRLLPCLANRRNDTLRFVHAVWRHGDRSPTATFATDTENGEATWPQGFGELSTAGARQHFDLGKWLRLRYGDFVQKRYNSSEIYVRSTDYNRTLMSAQANLAGFYYPPDGEQRFQADMLWQPIPVHTMPREMDYTLWMDADCPTERKLVERYIQQSEEPRRIYNEYKELIQFLSKMSNETLDTLEPIWIIWDPLNCEKQWNDRQPGSHPWPHWVNATVYDKLKRLIEASWPCYYPTDDFLHYRGGPLLKDIVGRMQGKADGDEQLHSLKYYIYSAHDTTTAALLRALGAYSSPPTYASVILIELHEIDGQFHVQSYYRNESSQKQPYKLEISGCPSPCTLKQLAQAKAHLFPKDWHAECGLTPVYVTYSGLIQAMLSLACLVLFTLLVAVSVAHWRATRAPTSDTVGGRVCLSDDDDSDEGAGRADNGQRDALLHSDA